MSDPTQQLAAPRDPGSRDRARDKSWLYRLASGAAGFWDFIDKRQIDVHLMAWGVLCLAGYAVFWAMEFVWAHPDKPGIEVGLIVAAITAPLTLILPKVVDLYFKARS